jgi:hypothetical protein
VSNTRNLVQPLTVTRGGSKAHRPVWVWKGFRPPRSARKRWELWMAGERLRKAQEKQLLKLPRQAEHPAVALIKAWAEQNDIFVTPWQEHLIELFYESEGKITVG